MKIFHTADWHLGKLVQGVYMTEDQRYVLEQFLDAIQEEKPDVVVIAGDLYDRAVPPTDAVHLLDEVLEKIVLELDTPVIAIAGNHDSPSRLNFGSKIMKEKGFHIVGTFSDDFTPVVIHDSYGEVHFHLVPYADPSVVRNVLGDDDIKTHNDATAKIVAKINENRDKEARHVYVGHAFVTPSAKPEENTSESERPLSIGGAEYVDASHFMNFHYTALGHLHQAHFVMNETIRYAGSILKYSLSEERHKKGFFVVEMDGEGEVTVEKRLLTPRRDIRTVEAKMEDLLTHPVNEDYVFVKLLDEAPVISQMEKVRSVYPNAMHVNRKSVHSSIFNDEESDTKSRRNLSELDLFRNFYKQVKGEGPTEDTEQIFQEVLQEMLQEENETKVTKKPVRS